MLQSKTKSTKKSNLTANAEKPNGNSAIEEDEISAIELENSMVNDRHFVDSDAETDDEELEEQRYMALGSISISQNNVEMPSEYWQMQKLIKFIKIGNQTATLISLCSMNTFDFSENYISAALKESSFIEILLNIVDTNHKNSKTASLRVLSKIADNLIFRRMMVDLSAVSSLTKALDEKDVMTRSYSANVLSLICKLNKARKQAITKGVIQKLVKMLEFSCLTLTTAQKSMNSQPTVKNSHSSIELASRKSQKKIVLDSQNESKLNDAQEFEATSACLALSTIAQELDKGFREEFKVLFSKPFLHILAEILNHGPCSKNDSHDSSLIIPVLALIEQCSFDKKFKSEIVSLGAVNSIIGLLKKDDELLQASCAKALHALSEQEDICDVILKEGGIATILDLLRDSKNIELLTATAGVLGRCASKHLGKMKEYEDLPVAEYLVPHLTTFKSERKLLRNIVIALSKFAKLFQYKAAIRKSGGLSTIVKLLVCTDSHLLMYTADLIGELAKEPESMATIDKLDGVRLLWSLLKSRKSYVASSAAQALAPCLQTCKDSGRLVRSFVGGLELVVALLQVRQDSDEVPTKIGTVEFTRLLTSVCCAIASIATDKQNLAVITDHGVVPLLSNLTNTRDPGLRCQLSRAIASCCNWSNNRKQFGELGVIQNLVLFLKTTKRSEVLISATAALNQLSIEPINCDELYRCGAARSLVSMIEAGENVQQDAAECLRNIRSLANQTVKC